MQLIKVRGIEVISGKLIYFQQNTRLIGAEDYRLHGVSSAIANKVFIARGQFRQSGT